MRHRKKGRQLSRTRSHRKATLRNLATSLFRHERIETTTAKAKELRPYAERLITLARRGDVHARRLAAMKIQDREILGKLFDEIAPRYMERPGGYTRIYKLGYRAGDNAPMALIELVVDHPSVEENTEAPVEPEEVAAASEESEESASEE